MLDKFMEFQQRSEAFRAASVAYSRGRYAALAELGFGLNRVSPSIYETKKKAWETKAAHYMRNAPKSMGQALVFQTPAQRQAALDGLIRMGSAVDSGLLDAVDEVVGGHSLKVFSEWPVATRLSKSAIGEQLVTEGDRVQVTVASGAPYTPYIKEARVFNEKGEQIGGGKKAATAFKRRYLVKQADGSIVFDKVRYEAEKDTVQRATGQDDPEKKPAKGRPFRDLLQRPAKKLAADNQAKAIQLADRKL